MAWKGLQNIMYISLYILNSTVIWQACSLSFSFRIEKILDKSLSNNSTNMFINILLSYSRSHAMSPR